MSGSSRTRGLLDRKAFLSTWQSGHRTREHVFGPVPRASSNFLNLVEGPLVGEV